MLKVIEIINEIANTSGRNDKEAILERNKDNELLKKVLKFIFDPFILTGMSDKKMNKIIYLDLSKMLKDNFVYLSNIEDAMVYLEKNNSGRDFDIALTQNFIYRHSENEIQDFLKQVFTKNLKIGITDKTLNKVFGKGFINSFSCMLAEKYFEHEAKVTGEFIITTKLDGLRCLLFKENGTIKMFSRTGQPYEGLVEIEEEAMNLPEGIVLDGELISKNTKGLNSADLFRETQKVVRKDGIKKNVEFHVFDGLTVTSFKNGIDKSPCVLRKGVVSKYIQDGNFECIKYVSPLYIGSDKDVIPEMLSEIIAKGHEGLMYNVADAPYETKRTRNLLKIKKFSDADVMVIEVLEGTNKNEGKLGAITIEFEHEGKLWQCNCGSGFTDGERVKYFANPELLIGKIVTVGYFEISKNDQGGFGMRFPTWKGIVRDDKTEISMY